jgi:4-hydroxy-tetrahydrodipicolinate reductase
VPGDRAAGRRALEQVVSAPLRIAVVGARGRMGRLACALVDEADDLELAGALDRADDLAQGLRDARAEVALDFTEAGLGAEHARRMLAAGVRPVIGTSGVSLEENEALDRDARERGLGGLVVPNFSLGVWVLTRACELAARHFDAAEIVELHHAGKKDAPSGTAVATAELLAGIWGRADASGVPIHSVRLPGLYSNQEVLFGGRGETLSLRHETYDIACFAPGILAALRYAPHAEGVARGIGPAFEHAAARGATG